MVNSRPNFDSRPFFQSRLIRDEDAEIQLDLLAWLMRKYGPQSRPEVPSPLHKSSRLFTVRWEELDSRNVADWAQDTFGEIVCASGMGDWPLQLIAEADGELLETPKILHNVNTSQVIEAYLVDHFGRPMITYDPRRCYLPGYFVARIVLRLAELRMTGYSPEAGLSPLMNRMLVMGTACYARQGFTLANLCEEVSAFLTQPADARNVPLRIVTNTLCFTACLNLRVLKQSPEQIIATYGALMPRSFRGKVRRACKQIDGYEAELKLLQQMAQPAKPNAHIQHLVRRA